MILATPSCRTRASSTSSTSSPSRCSSRACAGSPARRRPCAATASPRSAWRSRSIATLLNPGEGNWGLIVLGVALGTRRRHPGGAPGEDDGDAADGRAVQRRRRRRGVPDLVVRVPAHRRLHRRRDLHHDLLAVRRDRRLGLLLGLEHRLRQAPGNHPRAADQLRLGAADRQPRAADPRASRPASTSPRATTRKVIFIGLLVCSALLGNAVVLPIGGADMPVVISLLNAFTGLSAAATGIALEQHRADRRRDDRRRLRHDPDEPDGDRDEPLDPGDRRRRLRRRRRGRGRRGRRASTRARCARRAPPTPRSSSPTPAAW